MNPPNPTLSGIGIEVTNTLVRASRWQMPLLIVKIREGLSLSLRITDCPQYIHDRLIRGRFPTQQVSE